MAESATAEIFLFELSEIIIVFTNSSSLLVSLVSDEDIAGKPSRFIEQFKHDRSLERDEDFEQDTDGCEYLYSLDLSLIDRLSRKLFVSMRCIF